MGKLINFEVENEDVREDIRSFGIKKGYKKLATFVRAVVMRNYKRQPKKQEE